MTVFRKIYSTQEIQTAVFNWFHVKLLQISWECKKTFIWFIYKINSRFSLSYKKYVYNSKFHVRIRISTAKRHPHFFQICLFFMKERIFLNGHFSKFTWTFFHRSEYFSTDVLYKQFKCGILFPWKRATRRKVSQYLIGGKNVGEK